MTSDSSCSFNVYDCDEELISDPDDCVICLDALVPRGGVAIVDPGCGHRFHFRCLKRSTRRGDERCPICRAHIAEPIFGKRSRFNISREDVGRDASASRLSRFLATPFSLSPDYVAQRINEGQLEALMGELGYRADNVASAGKDITLDFTLAQALVGLLGSESGRTAEYAAVAVGCCARHSFSRDVLVKAGVIPPLMALLEGGTDAALEWAVIAIASLALTPAYAASVVGLGAIEALTTLVEQGTDSVTGNAVNALASIALVPAHRTEMVEMGAIEHLVRQAKAGRPETQVTAANVLEQLLVECSPYAARLFIAASGVPSLVPLLRGPSSAAASHVFELLASNEAHREALAGDGVVEALVLALRTYGSSSNTGARVVRALHHLAIEPRNLWTMLAEGAIAPLVPMLVFSSRGQEAVGALLERLAADPEGARQLVLRGTVGQLVTLVQRDQSRPWATQVLAHLTREKYEEDVVRAGAIVELSHLLSDAPPHYPPPHGAKHGSNDVTRIAAIKTLRFIAASDWHEALVHGGAVEPLVQCVRNGDSVFEREEAIFAIECLAAHVMCLIPTIRAGAMAAFVEAVLHPDTTSVGKRACANVIFRLADPRVVHVLLANDGLAPLLKLLMGESGIGRETAASSLVRVLDASRGCRPGTRRAVMAAGGGTAFEMLSRSGSPTERQHAEEALHLLNSYLCCCTVS